MGKNAAGHERLIEQIRIFRPPTDPPSRPASKDQPQPPVSKEEPKAPEPPPACKPSE